MVLVTEKEINSILNRIKPVGFNNVLKWITDNEEGAWEEEFRDVVIVLSEYRKRKQGIYEKRDSDVYHVMKLMGYTLNKNTGADPSELGLEE